MSLCICGCVPPPVWTNVRPDGFNDSVLCCALLKNHQCVHRPPGLGLRLHCGWQKGFRAFFLCVRLHVCARYCVLVEGLRGGGSRKERGREVTLQ